MILYIGIDWSNVTTNLFTRCYCRHRYPNVQDLLISFSQTAYSSSKLYLGDFDSEELISTLYKIVTYKRRIFIKEYSLIKCKSWTLTTFVTFKRWVKLESSSKPEHNIFTVNNYIYQVICKLKCPSTKQKKPKNETPYKLMGREMHILAPNSYLLCY